LFRSSSIRIRENERVIDDWLSKTLSIMHTYI